MTICLLLAAGSSSRMGQPKMLLPVNGKTLLQHTIDEIQQLNDFLPVVVTGCYHDLLQDILGSQKIPFVYNEQWKEGMGTSIQTGIKHIQQQYPHTDNIIILVCDQPFITADLLQQLITVRYSTCKGIIASAYNKTTGTPVLFDKKYFPLLAELQGQFGAKKIIQQYAEDLATVDFPEGAVDIDTMEDYEQLSAAE